MGCKHLGQGKQQPLVGVAVAVPVDTQQVQPVQQVQQVAVLVGTGLQVAVVPVALEPVVRVQPVQQVQSQPEPDQQPGHSNRHQPGARSIDQQPEHHQLVPEPLPVAGSPLDCTEHLHQ